jgi:transposase
MWTPNRSLRVWLYRRPTDMRKSYDGLSAMVKQVMDEDPLDGSLYVFVNRRRTQMKCLYFEDDGYCVWAKRLEQGRFRVRWDGENKAQVDLNTLKFIIDGIDVDSVRRFKRYSHRPVVHHHVQ